MISRSPFLPGETSHTGSIDMLIAFGDGPLETSKCTSFPSASLATSYANTPVSSKSKVSPCADRIAPDPVWPRIQFIVPFIEFPFVCLPRATSAVPRSSPRFRSGPALRRGADGNLPPEQEEPVAAQRAPVGVKKPLESRLDGVSCISPSKINGPAMRTARGEQPKFGVHHDPVSAFSGLSLARPA